MEAQDYERLSTNIVEAAEEMGLYAAGPLVPVQQGERGVEVGFGEDQEDVQDGAVLVGRFRIGDVAFTERIQDPDGFAADQEFQMAMPTEVEIASAAALDSLRHIKEDLDAPLDEEDGECGTSGESG